MDKNPEGDSNKATSEESRTSELLVYALPPESAQANTADDISFIDAWRILWSGKWIVVGITTALVALSVAYALIATEWYRADVVLAPANERSIPGLTGQLGGLGGLVGVAGINVGRSVNAEPIAVLRSRDFTRAFIEARNLLPVLLADQWDAEAGRWRAEDPADRPDIRDAVRYFNANVLTVSEDAQTALVTLSIEWTDPEAAADWADALVTRLNAYMRQRALVEAESNVAFLEAELAAANVVTLRQSIGSLLETELQKLMLAKGNEEYSFRVIDGAEIPKQREKPKRTLIVLLSALIGGALSIFLVFIVHGAELNKPTRDLLP